MWLGREKGACSTWWPHGQKVPRSSNANYLRTMEWVTAVLTFPLLSRTRGNITDWARWALWILWYIFNPLWFEPPQLSLPTILWVCGFIFNKLCKSEPFYVKAFSSSWSMQIVTLSPSLWVTNLNKVLLCIYCPWEGGSIAISSQKPCQDQSWGTSLLEVSLPLPVPTPQPRCLSLRVPIQRQLGFSR